MNKPCIIAACFIMSATFLSADALWSASEITSRYDALCKDWLNELQESLQMPPTNSLEAIRTLACLRCRKAVGPLLDNIDYPPLPQYAGYEYMKNRKKFAAYIPSFGQYRIVQNRYPVFLYLESIGVRFEDLEPMMRELSLYPFFNSSAFSLGTFCSGNFFEHYCKSRLPEFVFPIGPFVEACKPPIALPEITATDAAPGINRVNMMGGANAKSFHEYTLMAEILDLRFSDKAKRQSADLADTIRAMGHIRSLKAVPLLTENLTICPQVSTNAPGGYIFPAAEALIEIGPAIGYCFGQLEGT